MPHLLLLATLCLYPGGAPASLSGGIAVYGTLISHSPAPEEDRYPQFAAYYDSFGLEHPRPLRWEDLPKHGVDVTSCLFRGKERLVRILQRAKIPARFEDAFARLHIEADGKVWVVNDDGVVRHNGKDLALGAKDFEDLVVVMVTRLPYNDFEFLRKVVKRRKAAESRP